MIHRTFLEYLRKVELVSEGTASSYITYIKRIDGFGFNINDPADLREVQKRIASFPQKSQGNTISALRALSRFMEAEKC